MPNLLLDMAAGLAAKFSVPVEFAADLLEKMQERKGQPPHMFDETGELSPAWLADTERDSQAWKATSHRSPQEKK